MTGQKEKRNYLPFVLGIAAVVIIAGLVAAFLVHSTYYGKRWYKTTIINGVDVSGMTLEDSRQMLIESNRDYSLTINGRNNGSLTVEGDDIDYNFDVGSEIDETFESQHEGLAPLFFGTSDYELSYDVSYDKDKLESILKKSELIAGSDDYKVEKPVSAKVSFSKEEKRYVCVEESQGNKLKKDAFYTAVEDTLQQAGKELNLEEKDVYETPEITSESQEIQDTIEAYNNVALRYITWNMGEGVKEQITPVQISKWITYKNGKVKYDNDAIADWVEAFCLKYKTVGKTRTIKSHTGKNVKIKGGDYGWQLDYEKTLKQAKKALKQEIDSETINQYIENPTKENKKAITIKKKVNYLNTAYQKDYENFAVDWDTENYTEISISDQMVYVFRKGKVAFKCRCITGRPVQGRTTPTGAYFIKEHREAYTLTGADYKTPVTNWVRITWTGTGFHPATWQPWSSWTKDMYKTRGSHGCINLSPTDAKTIYDMTSYREAVFIY